MPPEICHAVFPAGFGVGSQQSLIFVRCNNYIGESCDDLLGATARNSVCHSSTCSQNFAPGFCPTFFNFAGARKGIKNGGQKWPKLGSVKLNFIFSGTVLGSTFGPCFQFPQVSQKCAGQGPRNFGGRNTAKLAARARSDKSSFRTFSSRFEMQLSISYCCLPAPCSYDGIKRRHHIGTHCQGTPMRSHFC